MEKSSIKGYDIILINRIKTMADNTNKTKDQGTTTALKKLDRDAYINLILAQYGTVCFQIMG